MIVKKEERYTISDLTFDQVEAICLGLDMIDVHNTNDDVATIATKILCELEE